MAVDQAGAGEGSATPDAGITLEDFAADAFGDVTETPSSSGESQPVATSDAAGAPPAERQQPTGEAKTSPEGSGKDVRTGEPPADATKPVPDNGAPTKEKADDSDPLATATPFSYSVNGQDKTFDGIKVLGDAGAIITADALPLLQRRLGERDNLFEQNKSQYDQLKDFERLSEWKTQGEDGKEQIMSGRDGLIGMRTGFAQLEASFNTVISAFKPDQAGNYSLLAQLIDVEVMPNGQQRIIINPEALGNLLTKAELAEARATKSVEQRLAQTTRPQATTSGRSEAPATALDPVRLKEQAPRIIDQAAQESGVDPKLLTPEDRAFLAEQFPRYVRAVTEDERRNDPNLRTIQHITDRDFAQLVARQANHRKELAKTAEATSTAAKENAARLAAAARGIKTPAPAPSTSRTTEQAPSTESSRATDADKAWALREKLAGGRF